MPVVPLMYIKLTPSTLQSPKRVLPQATATKKKRDLVQTKTKAATIEQSLPHNPSLRLHAKVESWPVDLRRSRPQESRDSTWHQSAPKPELPSTIPDSLKGKMLVESSQSQGDTQRLSPSVYEYYSKDSREARAALEKLHPTHASLDTQSSAPHTFQPGEIGHIDLLAMFEQPSIDDAGDRRVDDEEDDIDPLSQDVRADIFPESRRFQPPKTPASQGHKRKREVETSLQGQSEPKLPLNPFAGQMGSIDGLMDASQLFQATQAQTSPMTNIVPSDGLSDRPSPELQYHRPSTAGTLSSPARATRSSNVRAVTEPQTTYTTMKESQEARERQRQARKAEQALLTDELSDEEFAGDTQLRRRLRQQRYSEQAKVQFASVAARSAAPDRSRGPGGHIANTPSRSSPRKRGRQASEPVLISDDLPGVDGQGSITEDETEREESLERQKEDDADELAEENKENVEVPRTISRAHHTSQVVSSQPTPSYARSRNRNAVSQMKDAAHLESGSNTSRLRETRLVETGTEPDAIADSQSSQHDHWNMRGLRRHGTKSFSEPRSSLDARILVPQSQSSELPRTLRLTNGMTEKHAGRSSSQPVSSSSPQNKDLGSGVIRGSSLTQLRAIEGADAKSNHTICPSDARSHAEGTFGRQSKVPEISAPSSRSLRNTISNSENGIARIHSAQDDVPDSSNMLLSSSTTSKKPSITYPGTLQSRDSVPFETAPEHLTASPSRSYPQRMIQNSSSKQSSPTKAQRPRTISEIAADSSPPDEIGEIDIDIHILSNDDKEFQKVLHGSSPVAPTRKRRRGARGLALQIMEPGHNVLPMLPGTPMPPPSSAISAITPIPLSSPLKNRTSRTTNMTTVLDNSGSLPSSSRSEDEPVRRQVSETGVASSLNKDVERALTQISHTPRTTRTGHTKPIVPQASRSEQLPVVQPACPVATCPNSIAAPHRVLARFNGSNSAYYPATCLEILGGDEPHYRVRFDDGTVDTISAYGIKRLELKAGDVVKIDIPGARTKSYIVIGMRDKRQPATPPDPATPSRRGGKHSTNIPAFPETDVHGYATVLAIPKQRSSVDGNEAATDQVAVPLTQIYLTQTLWTAFRNRQYAHASNRMLSVTGLQTPSDRPSTPSTPSSRTRRNKMSGFTQSHTAPAGVRVGGGLFKNMVFAITNVDRAEDSKRITARIVSNGGVILNSGFDELFNVPSLNRTTSAKQNSDNTFHLTSDAQEVGFTCLIADKHCRRAKFIQALALGIPCLAPRWISDCIAKQRVLPWAPYLLASGESTFLGGAVRSRNLASFPADAAMLSEIVGNRPKLLEGASVLLIMEKGQEVLMKQHPLITYALGAGRIDRAISEDAAAKAVSEAQATREPWDWVFSYNKEKKVGKRLFDGNSTGQKRKRAREGEVRETPPKKAKTKVVGNEFVVQSLILGMLIDD